MLYTLLPDTNPNLVDQIELQNKNTEFKNSDKYYVRTKVNGTATAFKIKKIKGIYKPELIRFIGIGVFFLVVLYILCWFIYSPTINPHPSPKWESLNKIYWTIGIPVIISLSTISSFKSVCYRNALDTIENGYEDGYDEDPKINKCMFYEKDFI